MNNKRRETVRLAIHTLEEVRRTVDQTLDEEQDALSNIPENLEGTDRYSQMEDAVDFLDSAVDFLDCAIDALADAVA